MRLSSGENTKPGKASRVLNQKPQRPRIYIPPDVEGHKSDFDYLAHDDRIALPWVFVLFTLAAGVVLAAVILKVAANAAHIPIP